MPPKGKPLKSKKATKKRQVEEAESEGAQEDDELLAMENGNMPGMDQEDLSQEEKDEIIYKQLNSNNPRAAVNITRFSFCKDRGFKAEESNEHLVVHYSVDGDILLQESDEARDQQDYKDTKRRTDKQMLEKMNQSIIQEFGQDNLEGDPVSQAISLRNQFFYQERTSQTFNLPLREKGYKTNPPVTSTFSVETTQWMIYDAYMKQYLDQQRAELEEQAKTKGKDKKTQQVVQVTQEDPLYSSSMKRALKIMERMIVQNAEEAQFEDYKYYEDTTEDLENSAYGSVLPLWRFTTEKSRRKNVTAIAWNPQYKDLFAVAYGSYDFLKPTSGLICCFTIKNPTWPEYSFTTESGVMCIDFHPHAPALISVGCYDGTVMVFDIRLKTNNKPIY